MCRDEIKRDHESTLDAFYQGINYLDRDHIHVSSITVDIQTYLLLCDGIEQPCLTLTLRGPSRDILIKKE